LLLEAGCNQDLKNDDGHAGTLPLLLSPFGTLLRLAFAALSAASFSASVRLYAAPSAAMPCVASAAADPVRSYVR
jgi:hypothetical protein